MHNSLTALLTQVRDGSISVADAALQLREAPFEDLGYARVDHHRRLRQGAAEVIYGAGKTPEQIAGIVDSLQRSGQKTVLITRMKPEAAAYLQERAALTYDAASRIGIVGPLPEPDGDGKIVVATGGTSDIPVAEEAALTAEVLGNRVVRLYDVGVAGLHRLLASVIGGLVDCPVIAVPTSVGYGASFGGVAALLSMLNSCASGVSVVNIDNGFGAGYLASMINHMGAKP